MNIKLIQSILPENRDKQTIFSSFLALFMPFFKQFWPQNWFVYPICAMKCFLRPIIDNKTIPDEKYQKKGFSFQCFKNGHKCESTLLNKVETSVSKVRKSCLGYEMMAVAKVWGL